MGRPTKLTDEVQATIVAALEGGCTRSAAAGAAGIDPSTLQRWVRRGERADGRDKRFRLFCMAIKKAESMCDMRCLELINAAASEGRWQAAAWILERRWPQSWGRRRVEGPDTTQEIIVDLVP